MRFVPRIMLCAQILRNEYNLKGAIGVKSGGLDGPCLIVGVPTVHLIQWQPETAHFRFRKDAQIRRVNVFSNSDVPGITSVWKVIERTGNDHDLTDRFPGYLDRGYLNQAFTWLNSK